MCIRGQVMARLAGTQRGAPARDCSVGACRVVMETVCTEIVNG